MKNPPIGGSTPRLTGTTTAGRTNKVGPRHTRLGPPFSERLAPNVCARIWLLTLPASQIAASARSTAGVARSLRLPLPRHPLRIVSFGRLAHPFSLGERSVKARAARKVWVQRAAAGVRERSKEYANRNRSCRNAADVLGRVAVSGHFGAEVALRLES